MKQKKEEKSRRTRKEVQERFRIEVKRACMYSIPWAVAVMENTCSFLRGLPNIEMPTVELDNEDLVFRQDDRQKYGKENSLSGFVL